jgi:predicted nucleotidyltransferase
MFQETLSRIASSLHRHGLPYMIIGGQAVLLHGEPRLTRDIDVTLGVNVDHLDDVLAVVQELSLKALAEDIESFVKETMVLPTLDEKTGIRVDFIFSFTPYETEAIKRGKRVTIQGQEVNFASAEDLIIHKVFAGRPRDMEDVKAVISKNPGIDLQYIRNWLREFDKSDDSSDKRNFLNTFEGIVGEI